MDLSKARVLVGTPNYQNSYAAEAYASHMACVREWERLGIQHQFMVAGRTFVHFARTQICQAFMAAEEWTHLLWIDDDAIVDPELLPRMLEHQLEVVIAPYPMRRSPFEIGILIATHWGCECGHEVFTDQTLKELEGGVTCEKCGKPMWRDYHDHASYRNLDIPDLDCGVQEVDGGGTHCMLVDKSVMVKKGPMEAVNSLDPRLVSLLGKLSEDDRKLIDHNVGNIPEVGLSFQEEDDIGKNYFVMPKAGTEDMLWCYRAKQKGVKIWADTDIFADHMGFAPVITRKFRERIKAMQDDGEVGAVAMLKVEKGRDHRSINRDKDVNLV